ncbi:c-type cytochrome [Roseicella aerolata]|uniref:C-type cytochrome n=1 Tax=Roseicella aerolata TaxID=2883479 RepID=A0A9X1LA33_9PROT|nr:c-type cytochrome [Roseicella aerolata]MCB4821798.1 c-type cytochrome [Roseicella aerolata]
MHLSHPLGAALLATSLFAAGGAVAAGPAPLAAQGCLGCHGPNGAGIGSGARLAGREAAELESIMRAYRADQRQGTIMNRIARGYTEQDIAAIAAYFAAIR